MKIRNDIGWWSLSLMVMWLGISAGYGQANNANDKLRALEQRIIAIEDYLKQRINELQSENQARDLLLKQLQAHSRNLENDVVRLKESLRQAENDVLQARLEIAALKKSEPVVASNAQLPQPRPSQPEMPALPERQYQNQSVRQWVMALRSPEQNIRMSAIVELSRIADEEATMAIIAALQDQEAYVKMLSCKVLLQRKAVIAIPALLPLLDDARPEVRRLAYQTIETISGIPGGFAPEASGERAAAIAAWKEKLKNKGMTTNGK